MLRLPPWSPPYLNGESLPQIFSPPPTVRLRVEASDQWFAEAGDDAVRAAEAVIRGHEETIQQIVQAHRGYFGLSSGGGFQRKHATLPGLSLMHDVNGGLETLHITVRPENARHGSAAAAAASPSSSPACLLVLYGGNQIAAYSTKELPELKLVYQKTLEKSSWGSKPLLTSQFKFNRGTRSTVLSPLVVKKGVVSAGEKHSLTTCDSQFPQHALTQFVVTSTPASIVPLQNGSLGTLYTTHDVYAWGKGGWGKSGPGGDTTTYPVSVDKAGVYYYVPSNDTGFVGVYPSASYGLWDAWNVGVYWPKAPYGLPDSVNAELISYPLDGFYTCSAIAQGGGASARIQTGATLNVAQNLGVPVYSNDGHVDTVHVGDVSATFKLGDPDADVSTEELSCLGLNGAVMIVPASDNFATGFGNEISVSWFPPSLGSTAAKSYCATGNSLKMAPVTIYTPYSQSSVSSSEAPCIGPWLHVSNGRHVIQGYQIWSVPHGPTDPWNSAGTLSETHLYCDEVDISGKLPTAIENVQTVLMDVPLSRIRQLV